jgi:NitT/TauT family transport system substrate-binding protein
MRARSWCLALTTALALAASAAQAADPVKIRLAWTVPVANWGAMLSEKKDLATHLGKSYVLQPVHYAGSSPQITALAAGELDIVDIAYSTLGLIVQNAGMTDIRVIADEFQDGVPGYYSQEYFVLKDGPIKKIQDLKGQVVATNAEGSAVDVATKAMLRKSGLEAKRDYTVLETPFPTMRAMLAEKKVAIVPGVLPFSLDPQLRNISRTLFKQSDAIGVTQMIVWGARKPFLDKNRAAVVDFFEDTLRIVHWYIDPNNHDAVLQIAVRMTKQPAERFGWAFTKQDYYRDRNMVPNLDALQRNVDMTQELGFLKAKLNVKDYADLSLVEEAAKRLKN